MHDDDRPIGRVLNRREALALLSMSGAGLLAGCRPGDDPRATSTPGAASESRAGTEGPCIVRPAQIEGPYFVDEILRRSDLRPDPTTADVRPGIPLALELLVSRLVGGRCVALPGVRVDVWQCDAEGVYSGVRDPGFDTTGQKFLRGFQDTDASGLARFTTIYPGWYRGRTVHIHFKVRTREPRLTEFTSQLYFDDGITDRVHALEPYAGRGPRDTRNADDGIFRHGGERLMLALAERDDGWAARFDVALDLS